MKKQTVKTVFSVLAAVAMILPAAAEDAAKEPAAAPAAPAAAKPAAPKPTLESVFAFLPDVLAEVNGVKITKAKLLQQLSQGRVAPEMLAQLPQEMIKGLIAQQINEMVDQAVCLELAKKAGIVPSEAMVKTEMDKLYSKIPAQQKQQFEGELKKNGKTYQSYRDEIAKNPEAQASFACNLFLRSTIADKAKASVKDADVEKFYRENQEMFEKPVVTVSHILVLAPEVDEKGKPFPADVKAKKDAEAKAKIDGILAQLKQGAKFEDLAEKESACPSGKQAKGKLPPFTMKGRMANGQMEPTFTAAAVKLSKPGEISDVVKTPFGYHIIRLEEKKAQEYVPLADVKEQILAELVGTKIDQEVRAALDQGKKDMNVKVYVTAPAAPVVPAAAPAK